MYEVIDPEKVNWDDNSSLLSTLSINYDSEHLPTSVSIFFDDDQQLDRSIYLSYNSKGKLEKKTAKDIPSDNVFKFQAFKSNTAVLEDTIKNLSGITTEKTYTVTDISRDTLSVFTESFNDQDLLISRKRIFHKGYNGFGYSMDLISIDEERYTYDKMGILIAIEYVENNESVDKIEYKIIKSW